jgi:hypothetical protein
MDRSNVTNKIIYNKLIFIHTEQDYSKWSEYLEQTVQIYNNKWTQPSEWHQHKQHIEYEHEDDYNNQGRCQVRSDLTSRPRPDLRSYLFTLDLTWPELSSGHTTARMTWPDLSLGHTRRGDLGSTGHAWLTEQGKQ